MKAGYVALLGRTNAGKSTLINSIVGTKVAITSPKPKTTRFLIKAVYEEKQGQIIFIDTPGLSESAVNEKLDVVVYVIDHTRKRGSEENKVIGILRKLSTPKIVVFNKIDIKHPSFKSQYLFLQKETDAMLEVSALKHTNISLLIEKIFSYLPEREKIIDTASSPTPLLNMDSKTFLSELIREKIYLFTHQEVPYYTSVQVKEIRNTKNDTLYIKAVIFVHNTRYKKILIGTKGEKIKQIGTNVRKELEQATNRKVYIDINVENK